MVPSLDQVISWIESRGDIYAMRFEPRIYQNDPYAKVDELKIICKSNNCSLETAKVIAASSFGLFQVMGFNLYSNPLCYRGYVARYFSDDKLQTSMFYDFVGWKGIDYTVKDLSENPIKRAHFAMLYNGSEAYASRIVDSLFHFGVKTQ